MHLRLALILDQGNHLKSSLLKVDLRKTYTWFKQTATAKQPSSQSIH